MFKLALIQMLVRGGEKTTNLDRAVERIAGAARDGAEVVLLPEAMPLGWTHSSARELADAVPDGESCTRLRETAARHRLYVCAGVIERDGDRIFNSAVLFGAQGELLLHHRKLNELEFGQELYALGDRLQVARTPFGTIGLMICADAFARGQVISRTLGFMGAEIILSPCAWAVPPDHDNLREPYGQLWLDNYGAVAHDFRLWIAGASSVGWITDGAWAGRPCIGCSLLIDPSGRPVIQGPYGPDAEAVLLADVAPQPRPAQGTAWEEWWRRRSGAAANARG